MVGHTIQRSGINSTCDGRVHRIDVGLSKGCGDGTPQVFADTLSLTVSMHPCRATHGSMQGCVRCESFQFVYDQVLHAHKQSLQVWLPCLQLCDGACLCRSSRS